MSYGADLAAHLPPESATVRTVSRGEHPEWTLTTELLAASVDIQRWLQWAKTTDAEKRRNRPTPIPRPSNNFNSRKMKDALTLPIDELKRRLSLPRQEVADTTT